MNRRTLFKTLLGLIGFSALPKPTTIASDTTFAGLKEKIRIEMWGRSADGELWKFWHDEDGVYCSERVDAESDKWIYTPWYDRKA